MTQVRIESGEVVTMPMKTLGVAVGMSVGLGASVWAFDRRGAQPEARSSACTTATDAVGSIASRALGVDDLDDVELREAESRAERFPGAETTQVLSSWSPPWSLFRLEAFGRGTLVFLEASAEDIVHARFAGVPASQSISTDRFSRDSGWGVGARVGQGNWAVEATYDAFANLELRSIPNAFSAEVDVLLSPTGSGVSFAASRADLFSGQLVRTFHPRNGRIELSAGVGAGRFRARDDYRNPLLEQIARDLDELPMGVSRPEVELAEDSSAMAFVGSLGIGLRFGRILVRPRVDAVLARSLTTDLNVTWDPIPGIGFGPLSLGHRTSVRPALLKLSVDMGISN